MCFVVSVCTSILRSSGYSGVAINTLFNGTVELAYNGASNFSGEN